MSANTPKHLAAPVAAIRPGYHVAYPITVDGKEIFSRGEVFGIRRVGHNRAEITLMHQKTGSFFTNVLKGNAPVALTGLSLDLESGDALVVQIVKQLKEQLKEQASDFYSVMPIED